MSTQPLACAVNLLDGTLAGAFNAFTGSSNNSSQTGLALDLRFADTMALDSRITFTRASSGTYVDAAGLVQTATTNAARFTYNPTTLAAQGLLIEDARTNLFYPSLVESLTGVWNQVRASVTANSTTAPDGTSTASKIVEDSTATNTHYIYNSSGVSATSGSAYTWSAWVKAGERTYFWLAFSNSGGVFNNDIVIFNLSNGTVSLSDADVTTSIVSYPNGWYRISATRTALATAAARMDFGPSTSGADAGRTYTGNGTSGLYIWGAQMEAAASIPSSYIATTVSSATRAADVATMTGTDFSSWYNQIEGTFVTTAIASNATTATVLTADDGTVNNRIYMQRELSSTRSRAIVVTAGSTVASLNQSGIATTFSAALGYRKNDFALSTLGSTVSADTSGNLPTIDRLRIGLDTLSTNALFGAVSRIRYYRRRLPNSMLQSVSTAT